MDSQRRQRGHWRFLGGALVPPPNKPIDLTRPSAAGVSSERIARRSCAYHWANSRERDATLRKEEAAALSGLRLDEGSRDPVRLPDP
jgi:hypothetical protein